MSGPRSNGLGYPGQDAVEALGDSIEDITLNTLRLSAVIVLGGLFLFAAPYTLPSVVKGTKRMVKETPSLLGELGRLPFRFGGWLKQIRKDANPEDDK